jgi:hypothetical protein
LLTMAPSSNVIKEYLNLVDASSKKHGGILELNPENSAKPVRKIEMLCDGKHSNTAYMGCQLEIRVYFKSKTSLDAPVLGLILRDSQNTPMIGVNNKHYVGNLADGPVYEGHISMKIPYLTLFAGIYHADIHFGNGYSDIEVLQDCFQIMVEPMKFTTSGELPDSKFNKIFIKEIEWKLISS